MTANKIDKSKPLYVALSGGVDSAVSAALLVHAGYKVVGAFMKNWADNFGVSADCPWEKEVEDVKAVAEHLGIEWKVFNFEREYKERVLDYFFAEYKAGRTPNPDILCNNLVKFDLFAKRAFEEGASHMVTGHYARRQSEECFPWEIQGELGLYTAVDPNKDQTYFLQRLSRAQLARALFPLGNYYKTEVRTLAKHFNLPNANKNDSQGICFIGDVDVRDFIRDHLSTQPGKIIDIETREIKGKHEGLWFYTIGQRQGIGISSTSEPYFVVGKNTVKNELHIAKGHENSLLKKKNITIDNLSLITAQKLSEKIGVSIRYRAKPFVAKTEEIGDGKFLLMAEGQDFFWAPAEGQGALIYQYAGIGKIRDIRDIMVDGKQILNSFTDGETLSQIRNSSVVGGATISS